MTFHPTLLRQIRKVFLEDDATLKSDKFQQFAELVDGSYKNFDDDRLLIERSLEISSKELEEGRKKLSLILDNAPVGIYTINIQGIIEFCNSEFTHMSGSQSKERIGSNIYEIPAYKTHGLDVHIKDAFKGKSFDKIIDFSSGFSHRAIRHYRGVPIGKINTSSSDINQVILLVEDVTSAELSNERTKMMATLSDTNPFPVVKLSMDMVVVFANNATRRYFRVEDPIGKKWDKVSPLTNINKIIEILSTSTETSEEIQLEEKTLILHYKLVKAYESILLYCFDITLQRLAEVAARQRSDEFERINKLMVGRELKMIELKNKIKVLEKQ